MIKAEEIHHPPDDFLSNFCEDSKFYRAFQESRLPEFEVGYVLITRDGKRVSIVPYFVMDYPADLFVDNPLLKRAFCFLKLKAAFVGHPSADIGRIDGEVSEEILDALNEFLFTKARLVVYKFFETALPLKDFVRVAGMPIPVLEVDADYFSSFHGNRSKHLRRELNLSNDLEFREVRHPYPSDFPLENIYRLYLESYEHGHIRFEKLNKAYFVNTLEISSYLLAYLDGELIGFAQYLTKGSQICGKYLGMNYEKGKAHGLYFAMMTRIVKIAVRDGYKTIDFGVSGYSFKKWLGCRLMPTFVYFRHAHPVANWLLKRLKFLAEPSEHDLQ